MSIPLPYAPYRGRSPSPLPAERDTSDAGDNRRVLAKWDLLTAGAVGAARASIIGAWIRRFEKRWHRLGVRLQASRNARWFRDCFLTDSARRAWRPVPFRWWEGDPRGRTTGGLYDPDLEGGPDPSPWCEWPRAHRTARPVDW